MAKCLEFFEIRSTQKVPLLIVLGYRHLQNEEKELVWSHLQVESSQFGSERCPRLCLVIRQPWKQLLKGYASYCCRKNSFNVALKLCIVSCSFNVLLRKSVPRQVDKKSGVPQEEKGVWGSQGGDSSLEFSRRRKGQMSFFFFPLHSLVLIT